ncbi:hypothetical protein F2Q68_00043437 [Brassica cretica]|uniref:RNase H type-1 domain-containing protein n=1 Tax=Brassica cretica TaxID=69181 RepID=A0A8S9LQT0_BRACR|nr:hypothetical protein F2Q68_00043437 [Brassica cretica]
MDWMMLERADQSSKDFPWIDPELNGVEEEIEGRQQENDAQVLNGRWRCQTDASWVEQGDGTGLGFILFDGAVEVARGQRKIRQTSSPLHAETEGMAWAMEELRSHEFKHVSFESDCQQLVQILHSSKSWPALEPELDDIESLRISFIFFSLSFIPRSLNIRADTLAKETRSRELNFEFVDVLAPQQLAPEAIRVKNDRLWGESDCLNVRRSDGNRSRGVRRDRIKQNKPTLRKSRFLPSTHLDQIMRLEPYWPARA